MSLASATRSGIRKSLSLLIACALAVAGCAAQGGHDNSVSERPPCPRDMKLQCFEDQAGKSCSCVSSGEMQEMLEDLTGIRIH